MSDLFSLDPEPVDQEISPQSVYDTMMKEKGMEFGFQINVKDPRPDRSLSKEAMEDLRHNMISWVMTRILRKMKATGRGAKKIQVTVTVSLDGEERTLSEFTAAVPYFSWPDDAHKIGRG
jgi:hypothetical protein